MRGELSAVIVSGEAGVGKSRLVQELVEEARLAGARVLVGGCVELDGGGIPFSPLVDMLRALAREAPPDELDGLLGPGRIEIGRLVPELGVGGAAPSRGESEASRMLELVIGVIGRLAADRPLMLVFEDVHWADRATLDLLGLLVAADSASPLLLVFTVRSDELHRAHPFRRMAARWEQQRTAERLELERLKAHEVAAQIEAILGERPDRGLVDLVFERSEGIPLFVEEIIRAVRDGRVDSDFIPPSLRDVLLARAEQLSSDGQHVLRVVSAAARWAPDGLLAAVAELPASELYSALRETVEQQLLVVDPSGRAYGFRHTLAQAAIHDDLLPGERARLHRAYGEAVERTPTLAGSELDAASMLAHHWLAAHDLSRALPASVRAARAAASAAAPAAAQRHFELALELWSQVPEAERQAGIAHSQLLEAAADAAAQAGALDRALALVNEALAEMGDDGPLESRVVLLVRRGTTLRFLGRDDEGLGVLEQAVDLLPEGTPSEAGAKALAALARALFQLEQMQHAGEVAKQALQVAREVGAMVEEIDAQITLGHSLAYGGDFEEGLALVRAGTEAARRAGQLYAATRASTNLSDLLLMLGRYEEAISTIDQDMALVEQAGLSRTAGAFMRSNRAEALLRSGRWAEALSSVAPAAETGVFAGTLLLIRAELHVLAGRRTEAEADLGEARKQLRTTTGAQFQLPLAVVGAELARSAGDLNAARDILVPVLARDAPGEEPRFKWPVMSLAMRIEADRAQAARDEGHVMPDDIRQRASVLCEQSDAMSVRTPADWGHHALVRAEHTRLLSAHEPEAWADAVATCRAMNEPYPLAYALFRHAEALTGSEDNDAASAAATESLSVARGLGASPLIEDVEALMRRARLQAGDDPGATAAPGSDSLEPFGLTAREREVLRLVADGRSNTEIAQELFISRKTASVHVSNILSKLSVSTRVHAAAIAHRQGLTRMPEAPRGG